MNTFVEIGKNQKYDARRSVLQFIAFISIVNTNTILSLVF